VNEKERDTAAPIEKKREKSGSPLPRKKMISPSIGGRGKGKLARWWGK